MFYRTVACAALLAALPVTANATVIGFQDLPTTGPFGGNGNAFTTYAESGFTVTAPAGQYVQSVNGAAKSLLTGAFNGTQNALLTITGPALFTFGSFQAQNQGSTLASFTVTGYLGMTSVFSFSGSVPVDTSGGTLFGTFTNPTAANVDRVTIGTGSVGQLYIDNLTLAAAAAVPEPASWAMMVAGFGLLGVALRRRQVQVKFA